MAAARTEVGDLVNAERLHAQAETPGLDLLAAVFRHHSLRVGVAIGRRQRRTLGANAGATRLNRQPLV